MTTYNLKFIRLALFAIVAVANPAIVNAGPGAGHTHSHEPATAAQIEAASVGARKKLFEQKKIPAALQTAPVAAIEQIDSQGKKEWRVSVANVGAEKGKETLYLFFSLSGNFLAANFTGK